MHCERCKAINKDGAAFCRECGNPLTGLLDSLGGADTLVGEDDGPGGYVPPTPSGPGTVDKDGRIVSLGDSDTLGGGSFMAEAGHAEDLSTGDLNLEEGAGAPAASAEEEFGLTDTLADRFELLEKLGEGGMGVVYKARDRRLRRLVALKRLTARTRENKRAIERFRTEATTVASLDHAGIVRIYNLIEDERGICLELEFVGGGDLQSRLDRDGALPVDEACDIVAQLCDAVSLAHEQGVIHRDIKPANVLLTPRGTPKLSDFGLARAAESGRTVTGSLLGTLHYAAPEQLVSGKHVDERSDIYALGATLYALVMGEPPRTIRLERVPAAVRETVGTCLEENPAKRYQTAEELRQALEAGERRAARIAATACPECGSENPLDARFCQQCGGDLSALFRTCPKCGKDSRQDVEFCGGCGTNLARHFAVQALLAEALRLRDGHNHAEALRKCEEALELDPDHAEAGALAAELRGVLATITERLDAAEKAEEAGRLEEAVGCYEEVLQLQPGHEGAEGSISRLQEAIAESERRAKAEQGRILKAEMKEAQNRHDYERAIEKCRAILALYPAHPHAEGHLERLKQKRILQLGAEVRSAQRAGDLELAEDRCRAILAVEPQHREAQKYLERLERFASSNVSVLLRKAEKALDADDLETARDLCARVEELTPEDAAARDRIERIRGHIAARGNPPFTETATLFELIAPTPESPATAGKQFARISQERKPLRFVLIATSVLLAVLALPLVVTAGFRAYLNWKGDTALSAPSAGDTKTIDLGGGITMDLVSIPPGEFMMGSPENELGHDPLLEGPQHKVRITQAYWIGKYEVTQAQWQAVMGTSVGQKFAEMLHNDSLRGTGNDYPMYCVSWDDCQEFIERLNELDDGKFRLPTEAEWEYACRAGSSTAYCFGDDLSRLGDYAWYGENSGKQTHPVGQKKPNAWGLYDMHGNVWEWCEDWCGDYPSGAVTDPRGPSSGSVRATRGGGCVHTYRGLFFRSACRGGFGQNNRDTWTGFRVVYVQ